MIDADLQRLEGVWTGTERVRDGSQDYEASGRLVFQAVFDGRFLLCDYIQTAPERPTVFAHGVFRRGDHANVVAVTWFRSRAAPHQQADAVTEGDELMFVETVDGRTTRTSYRVAMDRLSVQTDCTTAGGGSQRIFDGSYRRR